MSDAAPIITPSPLAVLTSANEPLPTAPVYEYPLTSFASTPHNVACFAFLLGGLWSLGALSASALLVHPSKFLTWTVTAGSSSLVQPSLWNAITSPVLGGYLACWASFHLFEFIVTSIWNPEKLSVGSFLLNNGSAYHIAHILGILEYILEDIYLPAHYRQFKHVGPLVIMGFLLVLGGQILRSFAMITASSNFSHAVAFNKLPQHQLVTSGIYAWSRHPSYAGFVWWALGTQVLLANPIGCLAFGIVLYRFFSHRIRVEEVFLVKFFGKDYEVYRSRVPTRILFIQ